MFTYLIIGVAILAVEPAKAEERSLDLESMLDQPYCGLRYRRLCHGKGRHVACQFPTPGPGESCTNYTKIIFDSNLRMLVTNYINRRRQRIASGSETARGGVRIPQPEVMMQVEWDKELAMLAQRLADQCSFVHDDCRATVRFPYAGQTVGEVKWRWAGESAGRSAARAVRRVLDAWWGERRRVTVEQLTQPFRLTAKGNVWGHFSQIAVWTLRAVGCGLVRHGCQLSRILMVCDYSHTNMLGQNTIVPGKIAPCPIHTTRRLRSPYPLLCAPVRMADDINEEGEKDLDAGYEEIDDEPNDSEDSVVIPDNAPFKDKIGFEVPREEVLHRLDNGDPTPWHEKSRTKPDPVKVTSNGEEDYNDIDKNTDVETVQLKVKVIGDHASYKNTVPKDPKGLMMLDKLDRELKTKHRDDEDIFQFRQLNVQQRPTLGSKHSTEAVPGTRMMKLLEKQREGYVPSTGGKPYTPVSHRWRPDMPTGSPRWRRPNDRLPIKATPDYSEAEGLVMLSSYADEEAATHSRTRWRPHKAHSPRPGAKALPGITTATPEAPKKETHATRVLLKMAKEDLEQLFKDTGFQPSRPKIPVLPPKKQDMF